LLLHGHWQTQQRRSLAFAQRLVGVFRDSASAVKIADDHGVDLRVERLDTGDRGVNQFARRDFLVGECGDQFGGGAVRIADVLVGSESPARQERRGNRCPHAGEERASIGFVLHRPVFSFPQPNPIWLALTLPTDPGARHFGTRRMVPVGRAKRPL
jgi:hypothetical protein